MKSLSAICISIALTFSFLNAVAQSTGDSSLTKLRWFENATELNKSRARMINYTVTGLYPLSMTWLYTQWYRDYPGSKFHFFNDNGEWEQMDKFAHVWNAYNIAKPLHAMYRWAGYPEKKSALLSSGIALLYQTTIEVFDGFSEEWGFSMGDFACNTAGAALFTAQQMWWEDQRIMLKYSFRQTKYSHYRPDLLGSNLPENILKDYNGLTHWLCIYPGAFGGKSNSFPRWLGIAAGYGAGGMTGGDFNPSSVDGVALPEFERYRQYYLSLDIDLGEIRTKSEFLNAAFRVINIIHIPLPAIEFSPSRRPVYHGIYF